MDYPADAAPLPNARAQRPRCEQCKQPGPLSAMLGSRPSLDDLVRPPQQRLWDRRAPQGVGRGGGVSART